MANMSGNFGFRPIQQVGSGYNSSGTNEYVIANNEGSALFQGDPVILVANGAIDIGSTAGAELIGVFNGCFYTDPTTQKPTFSNYYPGSIAADDIVAYVFDDPNKQFEVKIDDSNGGQAQVGSNANIATYSAGSTINGISNVALDGSSFTTNAGANLRVVRLSRDVENSDYTTANANIVVKINLHALTDSTGI
ncbi:hypothetical protein N9Z96_00145 [bacterium]|jgi:uncharacterized Zn ribbon protein|nr:hypothetical protein [bacterium]